MAKSKVQLKCVSNYLFADDAAITTHSIEKLKYFLDRFNLAHQDLGQASSQKKMQVVGQDTNSARHNSG